MLFVEYGFYSSTSCFFFYKQKTAYEMRISDWSSDVCSFDLERPGDVRTPAGGVRHRGRAVPDDRQLAAFGHRAGALARRLGRAHALPHDLEPRERSQR